MTVNEAMDYAGVIIGEPDGLYEETSQVLRAEVRRLEGEVAARNQAAIDGAAATQALQLYLDDLEPVLRRVRQRRPSGEPLESDVRAIERVVGDLTEAEAALAKRTIELDEANEMCLSAYGSTASRILEELGRVTDERDAAQAEVRELRCALKIGYDEAEWVKPDATSVRLVEMTADRDRWKAMVRKSIASIEAALLPAFVAGWDKRGNACYPTPIEGELDIAWDAYQREQE